MQSVIVGGECENCHENREQMAQALSGLTDQELETIREILERGATTRSVAVRGSFSAGLDEEKTSFPMKG